MPPNSAKSSGLLSTRVSPTAMAARVVDLIRAHGLDEGAHLTEQWVADELDISRTPARRALTYLTDIGLVERTPRRGFHLAMPATELARAALHTEDDADEQLYFRIIDDHLGGRFVDDFTTTDLCQRYGLTSRQASLVLARMESEDLIRRRAARGWEFVRTLSTNEAHDQSYRFRLIIEPAGLREPTFTIDQAAFDVHRRQQESLLHGNAILLSRSELFRYNATFHEMIAECSGNAYLADAVRRINRMRRMIEYNHQADRSRLVTQASEHLQLLDLLEGGDTEAAATFMYSHLDVVRELKTGIPHDPHS
ncbi:GntR family transcriptional regulator [Mycobacterium sp. 236(2023)]|uniref:GntR family transcriptional regulator n=1 Tax=Mycobacterium sp. 236(2023) TaxID=3038163 RepID=UPI002415393E|nr:GntR family transcriptional regulator [Mycobacterium sp. 236(2023)]MDG4662973.1 GntR family transcriptional regulator [Mycobacterium sp. 236(2023)]